MTEAHDAPLLAGIPEPERSEYLRLFALVQNKRNWRFPISTTVTLTQEEVPKMRTALKLITGSRDIEITHSPHFEGEYTVSAEGHYNAAH